MSTAKQLAVAVSSKNVKDNTVLLVKPKWIPCSTSDNHFGYIGINFTKCKVVLHNLGSEMAITRGTNINQRA